MRQSGSQNRGRHRLWALFVLYLCVVASAGCLRSADKSEDESARIAALWDLKPGMTIADVGAGKGEFTVALARRIGPTGKVYSTELSADRRADIRRALSKSRLSNVVVIEAGEQETNLPVECCDAILVRDVYHHLTTPGVTNASLLHALRPNGLLAVIDFAPKRWLSVVSRPKGVPKNRGGHGIPLNILLEELTQAGFEKVRIIEHWADDHMGNLYCVLLRRPAASSH